MSVELFSLGKIYPSDFLKPDEQPRSEPIELKLVMEDNGLVHLSETAPKEMMWGDRYWYRSSTSDTMKGQLRNIVGDIISLYELKDDMVWLDIAGNDSYLLSQVPKNIITINVDPCGDSFRIEAAKKCNLVIQDYFSSEVYKKSKYGNSKADVVSVVSMFYDLTEPGKFLDDVYEVMNDDALLCIQLSYTPLMLEQLEFSNICHEHFAFYSLINIKPLLEEHRFQIMDVSLNNTNAGSFRIYAMKKNGDIEKFASQTHRDVSKFRIKSLFVFEHYSDLRKARVWCEFHSMVDQLKNETISFIKAEVAEGKTVYGYGASTKFNTVLQYFGLTTDLITAIADRSPAKHGLRCVGSNIPIISEEQMRVEKPDYLLIGPTHFLQEFKEREADFLERGGKFICIMPEFKIVSKNVNS